MCTKTINKSKDIDTKMQISIYHLNLMPKNHHCISILTFRSKNNFWCPL